MKNQQLKSVLFNSLFAIFALVFLTNCEKTPTPGFSYTPATNVEAGDSVLFSNISINALSYEWDFGDGTTSTDENPLKVYDGIGSVDVKLTATNETKSAELIQTIEVNDPTVIGIFVYEMEGETLLDAVIPDCEVWLYDNETDMQNMADPMAIEITDDDGLAVFMNLNLQDYYIICYKDISETNYWLGAWIITVSELNTSIGYNLGAIYETYTSGSKIEKNLIQGYNQRIPETVSIK